MSLQHEFLFNIQKVLKIRLGDNCVGIELTCVSVEFWVVNCQVEI